MNDWGCLLAEPPVPYPPLRRNREFLLFTAGQVTSSLGTGLLMLAVLLHVYAVSHSTRDTTVAFLAEMVPAVLLSPWAGVVADRVDRRRILIVADAVRGVLLVPLLVTERLDVLFVVLTAQAAVGAVFQPAYRSFLPSLVPGPQLAAANGFTSSSMAVLALTCPPAGAWLLSRFGFPLLVVIDMATFAVSVATLASIRARLRVPPQRGERTSVRRDLVVGARLLATIPAVRLLFATGLCFSVFSAFLQPLIVPFLQGVLHATTTQVGFVAAGQGVGSLLGGVVVVALTKRLHTAWIFAIGCWGCAAMAMAFSLAPSYLVALGSVAVIGVPSVLLNVGETTLLQTSVPDELLGRAMGLRNTLEGAVVIVGASVPAFAAGAIGVRTILVVGAAVSLVAAVVAATGARSLAALPAGDATDSVVGEAEPAAPLELHELPPTVR